MASSSSSPPPLAISSWSSKYHVFLSFRGEDTRYNFVGHLYSALEQKGIYTYMDDKKLPRGEIIGPSLMKAIEESQIAIIVFSENYADSSWCLEELEYIMKCKETRGQIVIPVFYGVDPSELRKQKRKYGEAFVKHDQLANKTKVESWRKALVDAGNISGWDSEDIANRRESEFIKEIVSNISKMLHPLSMVNDKLIGIDARMQDLKSKLQIGSHGVLMIGIWGIGGGGKTTLASSFYDEISREFDGCCFIETIREKSGKYHLKTLQDDILKGVLKERLDTVRGVEEGKRMLRDRLCRRKVIIVLDDVDNLEQLEALAGSHYWFGEGSLIIITTRDKHLLTAHRVDVIYEMRLLNDDEAINLFCMHATRDKIPMEDYVRLSKEVVRYAGGLPVALKVLGSFLCDKNMNEWMSALARLKVIPDNEILEKLKISYDGLKRVEQQLFLDIACFFRWEMKDRAMEMLDASGFYPDIGVKVLMQKSLITISNGMLDMHDLVQAMGHHIVRGEHPDNPEKHSRLWKKEDVLTICAMDATTELDRIEAIRFEYHEDYPLQHLAPVVANVKNLRWIDWCGQLDSPLLTNFPQRKLCCLLWQSSIQGQLWEGNKYLPNLKTIELWSMKNLITTPDFDGLPNLERFTVRACSDLKEIHPSIGRLERLVFLSIDVCSSLEVFPPITGLKKLETLQVDTCFRIFKLSEIQQNVNSSPYLHLTCCRSNVRGDTEVRKPGEDLIDVEEGCLEEPFLPHNNMNHHRVLWSLCKLQQLGLRKLNLRDCNLRDEHMSNAVWELPNLQELDLSANEFVRLSFSLLLLPRLKYLNVSYCDNLVELSALPSSIAVVLSNYCDSLESFGDISNCKWLWKVSCQATDKINPLEGDRLLNSMLQGYAIEDHFISISLSHQIPKGFVGRFFGGRTFIKHLPHDTGNTFTRRLPDDWYNDFCGFLMRIVTYSNLPDINIVFTHEVEENRPFGIWQNSDEAPEPEYDGKVKTHVGYVSFSSLRHTTLLNSSYNIISFSIDNDDSWKSFGAELVPRKSKGDPVQTTEVETDSSEFYNDELDTRKAFTIQHDSPSYIQILWQP